jgi:hypothetical protein
MSRFTIRVDYPFDDPDTAEEIAASAINKRVRIGSGGPERGIVRAAVAKDQMVRFTMEMNIPDDEPLFTVDLLGNVSIS